MTTLDTLELRETRDPYEPAVARLIETEPLTELERLFVFEPSDGQALGHRPGQFVQVWIPGVGEAPISICSSPTRGRTFELCVRRVGEVTSHLHRLTAGEEIGVRGPLGNGFDMTVMQGGNVLVIAGGLGLAPARSVIEYVLDERARFDEFHVLYGARSPAELLFRHDLIRWRHRAAIHLLVTVDRPDEQWRGRSGVVTKLFADLPRLNPERTCAVVIGPPVMFKFVVVELLARGIPQDRIFCSLERRMRCGIGKCGHCQINADYVCVDGPVFTYERMRELPEAVT
ncbi:MAG: Dihydroorotate dehydrogenase B (NAD(+)), electron transfer subunit [Phycisphaerae bacterium]|nr:Dihydroorotate dehydrogenase B (NAD(+)), electron transfer subunit [Phycisphaerae bacterium]